MKDISSQAESTTSVVRLAFQLAHRDKIEVSEEWHAAMDNLKQEPDLGFITKGFLSGNIDHIFLPLQDFLTKKPRLMYNICSVSRRQGVQTFVSDRSGFEVMNEIMIARGPANAIESVMKKILKDASHYLDALDVGMDFYDVHFSEQTLLGKCLYRVSGEYARDDIGGEEHSEEHTDWASFALLLQWFSPSRRAEFQDPNIPDRAIPPVFQEFYGSNWWQQKVMKPLEEAGATISSWTYHKGQLSRGRKGRLVISKFKHWLEYGYMDDDSLAQFERQLAEKDQQSD
ncbi:hypothetical protein GGI43DRAFT_433147 [Trichoderma evansii]